MRDTPISTLLGRLEGVKQTGADRWVAKCPAHDDKKPSLSIRDADGKLLLHCWAGCSAAEVVSAVGLTLADLFEKPLTHNTPGASRPWRDSGLEALRALSAEGAAVFTTAALMAGGLELTEDDRRRMILAVERINGALALVEGR